MYVFFCPDSEAIGVITSSIGRVACLRFGAGLLVQLQGCRCRVPLQGAAVRVLFALWSLVAGALQGAAAEAVQGAGLLFIFPPHFQAQKGLGGLVCL